MTKRITKKDIMDAVPAMAQEYARREIDAQEREPDAEWKISGHTFKVFDQGRESFAVRVHPQGEDSFWLKEPESRFCTLSGANYAILLFLERLEEK
jgi:hypothetical protein